MAHSSHELFLTNAILKPEVICSQSLYSLIPVHLPTSNASSTWQPFNWPKILHQKPRRLTLQGIWEDPLGWPLHWNETILSGAEIPSILFKRFKTVSHSPVVLTQKIRIHTLGVGRYLSGLPGLPAPFKKAPRTFFLQIATQWIF